jgi:hypothetical protein
MPDQKFVTVDIGSAWTKAFLVNLDSGGNLSIAKSKRLPTSWGDFSITTNFLLTSVAEAGAEKIIVSHFPEIEKLAKKLGASFVSEEASASSLVKYFKVKNSNFFILDAGASSLRESFQAENIGKYLTFQSSLIYLENFVGEKRLKPHILPSNTKELEVEEGFVRSNFSSKLTGRNKAKQALMAVTGGAISGTPRLSRTALMLLDTLGKEEVAQVVLDREFFLPSFGALLASFKQLHTSGWGSWLEPLGAFVSLGGALGVELDWGYSQLQKVELEEGEISLIPAPHEQKIKLKTGNKKNEKKNFEITGGSLGVLLDSRSKPLPLSFGQASSRKLMSNWLKQIEQAELNKEAF